MGEGEAFWLWVRRDKCRGLALNADLRWLGRVELAATAPPRRRRGSGGGGGGDEDEDDGALSPQAELARYSPQAELALYSSRPTWAPKTALAGAAIVGHVLWGNIPDPEYSECVGRFMLTRDDDDGDRNN